MWPNITLWICRRTADEFYIGHTAQQFYQLFNTGINNTSRNTVDPAGVVLIGVQELSKQAV